jgi:hypothetical protein
MRVRIGTSGLLLLIALAVIILIAGLRWLGSNAAAIRAGVGTGVLVLVVAGVLGLAVHLLLQAHRAERLPWQRPVPPPVPPATMTAEVLPAAAAELTAPAPVAAIAPAPAGVTVVVSTAEAAEAFARGLHVPPPAGGQGSDGSP